MENSKNDELKDHCELSQFLEEPEDFDKDLDDVVNALSKAKKEASDIVIEMDSI